VRERARPSVSIELVRAEASNTTDVIDVEQLFLAFEDLNSDNTLVRQY